MERSSEKQIENELAADIHSTSMARSRKRRTTHKGGTRSKASKRRRRAQMKEKLRAMVPKVTKMDKASMNGELQICTNVKKLGSQISMLDDSVEETTRQPSDQRIANNINAFNSSSTFMSITKVEVVQVWERGFYVKVMCNKGHGVAISLYKALESFKSLDVESSILVTAAETFVLQFTLNVRELEVNMADLKLWVAGAFLNQGFDFKISPSSSQSYDNIHMFV